ncbi:MAG: O-antigen ligase family protein [bacterium]
MDAIVKFGLIFLIVYCPLAFGSVHAFSFTLMEIVVLTLGFAWLMQKIHGIERDGRLTVINTPLLYFVLPFIGLMAIQLLPWPASWVKIISPNTVATYQQAWGEVPPFISLSLHRYGTRLGLFKVLAYAGVFFLVINWADTRERIRSIVTALIVIGSVEAIYGILAHIGGHNHIWWYKRIWYTETVTGTYVNRNHLAGLLELVIPIAFGLLVATSRKTEEKESGQSGSRIGGLRGFILGLRVEDHVRAKKILLIFLTVVMALALFLSGSRGGILSLTAAFLFMSVILAFRRRFRRYAVTGLIIGALAVGYGIYTGLDTTISRFERLGNDAETRLRYAKTSLEILRDFPLLGTGWGTFGEVYRRYQDRKDTSFVIDHAHHDWIELGTEMGVLGLGLVIVTFLFCLGYFIRLWRERKNRFSVGIGLGGMVAMVSLALHSFTDFNIHIPANALLLSVVTGITLASLRLHHHSYRSSDRHSGHNVHGRNGGRNEHGGQGRHGRRDRQDAWCIPFPGWLQWPATLVLAVGFGLIVAVIWRPLAAERFLPTLPDSTRQQKKDPALSDVCRAIQYDDGNAQYFYRLAMVLKEKHEDGGQNQNQDQSPDSAQSLDRDRTKDDLGHQSRDMVGTEKIAGLPVPEGRTEDDLITLALQQAIRLNPMNPSYHLWLGRHLLNALEESEKHQAEDILRRAEREFDRAIYFMPESAEINFFVGSYWIWKSKMVDDEQSYREAFDYFINYFRKTYQINRRYRGRIQKLVKQYYPVEEIAAKIFRSDLPHL